RRETSPPTPSQAPPHNPGTDRARWRETTMAKHMDAETIAKAVEQLEEHTRRATAKEIVTTLSEGWPQDTDPDTWQAGFVATMATKKFSEMSDSEIRELTSPHVDSEIVDEVADLIADWFGRSAVDADRELAKSIIWHLRK